MCCCICKWIEESIFCEMRAEQSCKDVRAIAGGCAYAYLTCAAMVAGGDEESVCGGGGGGGGEGSG
jgi:hypothetical protein